MACHKFLFDKQIDKQVEGTLQAFITDILADRRMKHIETILNPVQLTWLTSLKTREAGMFLQTLPKSPNLELSNSQFTTALRFRYQFKMCRFQVGTRCTCTMANVNITPDQIGHHILTACYGNGSKRIELHNSLVHAVNSCLKYSGMWTILEERAFQYSDNRPDISIRNPIQSTKNNLFLDIAVVSPYKDIQKGKITPPTLNRQPDMEAITTKLRAASKKARSKESKYLPLMATRPDSEFSPFIFETSGSIHQKGILILQRYAKYAAEVKKIPYATIYDFFLKMISVSFQRTLANSLNDRIHVLNSRGNWEILHPEFNHDDIIAQTISF
jgi:hypothetical protein